MKELENLMKRQLSEMMIIFRSFNLAENIIIPQTSLPKKKKKLHLDDDDSDKENLPTTPVHVIE